MATVLVVGAQGCLGTIVVNELSQRGWKVLRGGRHPDSSDGFRLIDLDEPATWNRALFDVDIVISTVPHPELPLERHILEFGGLLLSPATIPRSYLQKFITSAGSVRGTVIPQAGLTPGLGNLLAAELLRSHPQASEIAIGMTFSRGATGKEGIRWLFSHFEFCMAEKHYDLLFRGLARMRLLPLFARIYLYGHLWEASPCRDGRTDFSLGISS